MFGLDAVFGVLGKAKLIAMGVLALVLIGAVVGYGEWRASSARDDEIAHYELQISRMRVEAASELSKQTTEVRRLEDALAYMSNQLEDKGREGEKLAAGYERRLADAAAAGAGRLRDPHAAGCRGDAPETGVAAGPVDHPVNGGQDGGLLSVQLSDLLRARLREADAINVAYGVCRTYTLKLEDQIKGGGG